MLRKLVLFLTICAYPLLAMADGEYYTDEAYQIVDSSKEIADSLRQDYAELEKQILELDPDYAKSLQLWESKGLLTDEQKLIWARSYLAQKTFDYYKDTFMSELEQRSKETGRKVKQEGFGADTKYNFIGQLLWLDRGKLDSNECMRDGYIICRYPDKFEDFQIELQDYSQKDEYGIKALFGNNNYAKIINYDKDILDKNVRQSCEISLDYQSHNRDTTTGHTSEEELFLDIICDVEKYDEYYAWLNQEVENAINGKHDSKTMEMLGGMMVIGRDYNYRRHTTTTHKDTK